MKAGRCVDSYLADEWKLIQAVLRLGTAIIPKQLILLRKLRKKTSHHLRDVAWVDICLRRLAGSPRPTTRKDADNCNIVGARTVRRPAKHTEHRRDESHRMVDWSSHLDGSSAPSSCWQVGLGCPSSLCKHPQVCQAPCHCVPICLFYLRVTICLSRSVGLPCTNPRSAQPLLSGECQGPAQQHSAELKSFGLS